MFVRSLAALLLVGALGCGDAVGPFQPEITNTTNTFQIRADDVAALTTTLTYTWTNTGTRATVYHATGTTAGNVQFTVKDANGTVVYNRPLGSNLNEPTAVGTAGAWTVELRFSAYSGNLNVLAQKL